MDRRAREGGLMTSLVLVAALVSFLAGVATAVFLMLFTGIRRGDRPERIAGTLNSRLDARARSVLGSCTWPNVPVYPANPDDE
jgi:hypothetical protein